MDKPLPGSSIGTLEEIPPQFQELLRHVPAEEIPASNDLFSRDELEAFVNTHGLSYSFIAVGDIMVGERADEPIEKYGTSYPFRSVLPLLNTAPFVFGNLEGPLAPAAWKRPRNHAYAVKPERAQALRCAGIDLMTLANNHLTDCGPEGVLETLRALECAGIAAVGAGINEHVAHLPVIRNVSGERVAFLGFYWHRRCAAKRNAPGAALDTPDRIESDIGGIRAQVDRIVVAFHWGIPYQREPLPEDRAKARFAIECGADIVIGHHPHVIQGFEIYRGRPIFYSVGNFAFGTGNSRAESLLLGIRFCESRRTLVDVFPIYVKNRDPRVNYQPKVLNGEAQARILALLAKLSGPHAEALKMEAAWARLHL